ncbi:DoxX family protein [Paludisphaera mucosa]|uniref:DoxX family protein n=1 Tax=Paludisphaera mucosa TaxID=3030827 RepID=A0ABT6F4Q2_9BACT|nr:DoxX family protein [Paludisphaera mucosa]MDG3002380.1 DoxX family protein [Paludisphaera mucosa]
MAVGAWKIAKVVAKTLFAALFIAGGVAHFVTPETYMKIMPDYLPYHRELVLLSGVFEVALGVLLLIPRTSRLAAWGLIALLVAVFPANVEMYRHAERFSIPPALLLLRLPLQGLLILWAYAYTRRSRVEGDRPRGASRSTDDGRN